MTNKCDMVMKSPNPIQSVDTRKQVLTRHGVIVKITCFKVIVIVIGNLKKTEVIVIVIDSQVIVLVIVIYNLNVEVIVIVIILIFKVIVIEIYYTNFGGISNSIVIY